jgi:putative transposase
MHPEYPIDQLCATLNVTRSGYHAWVSREPGVRAQANGSPRIRIWLQEHGQSCGRQRISKLMRAAGLSSRPRRRFRPVSLTDSNHDLPVAPNRLRELAAPKQRDAIWVADITYVETAEGWLYVAGVLDRCTRRCVG